MKRKWLYVGVAAASVLFFLFDRIWRGSAFAIRDEEYHPIVRESPQLVSVFLGGTAFALLVGFFYLHVPDQKRSLRSGMTIGTILGLLVGMYQYGGWYGIFSFSCSAVFLGIVRTAVMGTVSGAAIAIAEMKMNARTTLSSGKLPA